MLYKVFLEEKHLDCQECSYCPNDIDTCEMFLVGVESGHTKACMVDVVYPVGWSRSDERGGGATVFLLHAWNQITFTEKFTRKQVSHF